jgi:outer membrane lipoprotein-sorting protein
LSNHRVQWYRLQLLLSLLAFGACAPSHQLTRHNWTPQGTAAGALVLAQSELTSFEDLTAEAKITIRQGRTRRTVTASILYRRPDLFRVDVRGPLYSHLLSMLLRGTHVTALGGETWQGQDAGFLLSKLTAFELGDYDLRYALLGLLSPLEDGNMATQSALRINEITYPRADRAVVELQDGTGNIRQRLVWIDLQSGFVFREQLRAHNSTVWTRELADYIELETASGPVYLPRKIIFEQGDVGVELSYKNYRVDEGLSAKTIAAGFPPPPSW